ncbi:MAG: hypothetical protein OHK0015_38790 [Chloroflexi bacterium OHK40]
MGYVCGWGGVEEHSTPLSIGITGANNSTGVIASDNNSRATGMPGDTTGGTGALRTTGPAHHAYPTTRSENRR